MKKFFVTLFSLLLLSGSAFAVTPGYNPETGEIILPSEAALYENNASTQTDLAEIQAAEARRKPQKKLPTFSFGKNWTKK